MVESDIVLLYIQSHVWGIIYVVGPGVVAVQTPKGLPCDVRQWEVLDIAIDEVSGALSMHATPLAIWTIVVPAGVIVMLGLHSPPRSWAGTVGPSLPDFTMASCVDSLLCDRSIRRPKSILQNSPEV
jgi:hypothetical protein